MRFELGAYALNPDIKVVAPWREWDLTSREALMAFCERHQIPVDYQRGEKSPYSMDANLLHISYEGGGLEGSMECPPTRPCGRWTVAPEAAPDNPAVIELEFAAGDAVALDGEALSPAALLGRLNAIGGAHGIGRDDLVENRAVGHEVPGLLRNPRAAPSCSRRTVPWSRSPSTAKWRT